MNDNYIKIFDTTLRDGLQTPSIFISDNNWIKLATLLDNLGVDIIEAGFPISSKKSLRKSKKCGFPVSSSSGVKVCSIIPFSSSIKSVCSPPSEIFCIYYDVTDGGNFEGNTILANNINISSLSFKFNKTEDEISELLKRSEK